MRSMSHTRFQQASHFKIGLTRSTSKDLIDCLNFTLVVERWIIARIRSHRVIPRDKGLFKYFS